MVTNTAPKAGPSISDTTPTQGSAVTASSAPIVDPDGTTTSTITFQWQQNKGGNTAFADIAGATGPTFTPGAAQVNKRLRVVASYVDDHGTTELIATPQTTVVGILITNGSGNLTGTAGDDNITGGAGHDTITGLGGNDILNGGGGNDAINGGAGDDTINGGPGTDTIDGDAGNDTLAGDEGNDIIIGNGGADTIRFSGTGGGFDSVTGGGETDTIVAMTDNTVIGLTSVATVETITASGHAGVRLAGSGAADTLNFAKVTLTGIAEINGAAGDDTITGSNGADTILGDAGTDNIIGGAGDDILEGGAGDDSMNGSAGQNTVRFTAAVGRFGADTINGFDANPANGQDHILLSGFGITTANFASRVTLATVKGTGNTLVTVKDAANVALGTITVVGTTPGNAAGQMTITDFQLA